MSRDNFKGDLSWGEKWEHIVGMYMMLSGLSNLSFNKDYKWDIKGTKDGKTLSFEIKSDRYKNTGNMALEIRDAGKSSGISKSEADIFIYNYTNLDDKYVYLFFIEMSLLRQILKDNCKSLKIVYGGDDKEAEIILLPMKDYKQHFTLRKIPKADWESF